MADLRKSFTILPLACFTVLTFAACSDDGGGGEDTGSGGDASGTGGDFVGGDGDAPGVGGDAAGTGGGSGGTPTGTGGGNTGGAPAGSGGDGSGGDPAGSGGDGSGGDPAGTGGDSGGGMSAGCGASEPPTSGDYTIEVNGKTREYTLDVPDGYDTNSPYPVTFGLHWRGGNSGDVVNNGYYGLKAKSNGGMIFVSPEGLVAMGTSGWANDQGEDVELIAMILDRLEAELCIDTDHVFATGFSYGGMFSNAIACGLGERFRAVAPYAGSLWSGCEDGSTPVAYFGTHGTDDNVVGIDAGRQARDEFISRNGCSNTSSPIGSNGCVEYEGCTEGAPLVWCEYGGGHGWPDWSDDAVWDFFSRF